MGFYLPIYHSGVEFHFVKPGLYFEKEQTEMFVHTNPNNPKHTSIHSTFKHTGSRTKRGERTKRGSTVLT